MRRFQRLTRTGQLDRDWVESELFPLAESLRESSDDGQPLQGRSLYLLFYEPSFLTRTSFERAMGLLGGTPLLHRRRLPVLPGDNAGLYREHYSQPRVLAHGHGRAPVERSGGHGARRS